MPVQPPPFDRSAPRPVVQQQVYVPPAQQPPGRRHRPLVALLLSIVLPGGGQAYNGQPIKGFFLLFFSVLVLPYLYGILDAYLRARAMVRSGGRYGKGGWIWVFLQLWLAANVALMALIIVTMAGVIR